MSEAAEREAFEAWVVGIKRLADLLDRLCEQLPTMQDRETVWCMIRGDDLREVVRLLTAMQTPRL